MQVLRKCRLWLVSILWLCICQSCTTKDTITQSKSESVRIDSNFTSQSLNEQVLVCSKLSEKDLTRKDLKSWIIENKDSVSQKKEAILTGNCREYPQAWFYTQIINTTNENQVLVADEFNRLRCDAFELYTIENNGVKKWGSLNRSTPFSKYPLPYFTYALPFTIQPKDTLTLVIHTQRHYGLHEVNLNVSTYENYLSTHFAIFLTRLFQITIFMILAITMLILGQIFRYKSMIYWGLDILAIVFVHITTWGFIDPIVNFPNIGLSGSNVSVFGVMVAITPPLFLLEWMKPIPKNEKAFKSITYSIFGITLFFTVCFLFPKTLFNLIHNTVNLTLMMIVLTMLNIFQMFFYGLLAWIRVKKYYLFVGMFISYAPFILSQTTLFSENTNVFIKSDNVILFFTTMGTVFVGVYLLREQLVTRKKLEENLGQLKETLEDIRKTEVETIGRNLHDQVGNTLASALGYLNLKILKVDLVQKLIMESINEIRFLSHNLVKDEDKPITEKLEALVARFNDFSTINFQYSDFSNAKINSLEPLNQQNIYMIIQEIMTNIIRHSKATEAYIQIFENEKNIAINIEDDGIGMANLNENKGIGLKNIQKRVEVSNLKITTDSTPNGTNFIIEIPYGNSNSNH